MNPLDWSNIDKAASYQALTGKVKKRGGRPHKYHLDKLNPGESLMIWTQDITVPLTTVQNCVYHYARKTDKKFETESLGGGLEVRRLS